MILQHLLFLLHYTNTVLLFDSFTTQVCIILVQHLSIS